MINSHVLIYQLKCKNLNSLFFFMDNHGINYKVIFCDKKIMNLNYKNNLLHKYTIRLCTINSYNVIFFSNPLITKFLMYRIFFFLPFVFSFNKLPSFFFLTVGTFSYFSQNKLKIKIKIQSL